MSEHEAPKGVAHASAVVSALALAPAPEHPTQQKWVSLSPPPLMLNKWDKASRVGLDTASTATSVGFAAAKQGTKLGVCSS